MRKRDLLTIAFFVTVLFCNPISAQEKPDFSEQISEDSLKKVLSIIDHSPVSISELEKLREIYLYRSRVSPTNENQKILSHIEKRILFIKKEEQ